MHRTNGIIFVRFPTLPPYSMNPPRFQMAFSRNPEKSCLLLPFSSNKTPRDLAPRHCTNQNALKLNQKEFFLQILPKFASRVRKKQQSQTSQSYYIMGFQTLQNKLR